MLAQVDQPPQQIIASGPFQHARSVGRIHISAIETKVAVQTIWLIDTLAKRKRCHSMHTSSD